MVAYDDFITNNGDLTETEIELDIQATPAFQKAVGMISKINAQRYLDGRDQAIEALDDVVSVVGDNTKIEIPSLAVVWAGMRDVTTKQEMMDNINSGSVTLESFWNTGRADADKITIPEDRKQEAAVLYSMMHWDNELGKVMEQFSDASPEYAALLKYRNKMLFNVDNDTVKFSLPNAEEFLGSRQTYNAVKDRSPLFGFINEQMNYRLYVEPIEMLHNVQEWTSPNTNPMPQLLNPGLTDLADFSRLALFHQGEYTVAEIAANPILNAQLYTHFDKNPDFMQCLTMLNLTMSNLTSDYGVDPEVVARKAGLEVACNIPDSQTINNVERTPNPGRGAVHQ